MRSLPTECAGTIRSHHGAATATRTAGIRWVMTRAFKHWHRSCSPTCHDLTPLFRGRRRIMKNLGTIIMLRRVLGAAMVLLLLEVTGACGGAKGNPSAPNGVAGQGTFTGMVVLGDAGHGTIAFDVSASASGDLDA